MKFLILISFYGMMSLSVFAQTLRTEWVQVNTQGCKASDPYFSDGITLEWDSRCVNNKAHGFGKMLKYFNGVLESTYEGEYNNGIREGIGIFTHSDGAIKKGVFKNGQLSGYGSISLPDKGYEYTGNLINYTAHGEGRSKLASGVTFEGYFVVGQYYTGKYTNYDGKITYFQKGRIVEKIQEDKQLIYSPKIGERVIEYFDKDWKRCDQKNASFYRLITYESSNKPLGVVKDYYITGQLQSEFLAVYIDYYDDNKTFHEGEATWFYKNGKKEKHRYYYNSKLNGTETYYFSSGEVAKQIDYYHGIKNGYEKWWYKTGKPQLIAVFEDGHLKDDKFFEFDENGMGALVYKENFQRNKEVWELVNPGNESEALEDSKLSLRIQSSNKSAARLGYISLNQDSDFSIEAIVEKLPLKNSKTNKTSNVSYGLVYGFKDWDNCFRFLITDGGYYYITKSVEGIDVPLVKWKQSSAVNINTKKNLLKVMKLGDEFLFSINGKLVEKVKATDLRGNYSGLIASDPGQYILEDLIIKEFMSSDQLLEKVPDESEMPKNQWKGNGSGFFINEKGYMATNHHVIEGANYIQVEYFSGGEKKVYQAKVILKDEQNDLAILKIEDSKFERLKVIPYVFDSEIKDVGTEIFTLGYPIADVMGSEVKFTDGKISSKTGIKGDIRVYQISVPIQGGNSGGPLFDINGNLIGITSSGLNREYFKVENVNYAIKASYLKNLVDVLPEKIILPNYQEISNLSLTEKIKKFSEIIPIIRVR